MHRQLRSIGILVLSLFFYAPVFGQGNATIRHFQRKADLRNTPLIVPCDSLPFSDFYILIPKSEYNDGTINVRKAKLPNRVKSAVKIEFSEDRSVIVSYTCKRKFANALESQINAAPAERTDGCIWSLKRSDRGRKVELKLTTN